MLCRCRFEILLFIYNYLNELYKNVVQICM